MSIIKAVKIILNYIRNIILFKIKYPWVEYGKNVHVQQNVRIFSPNKILRLGNVVGIGSHTIINTDVIIGNHVMIAAHCGLVSRDAHDHNIVGTTMSESNRLDNSNIIIEDDVWLGFGAIVLSGVTIGRGSIIAAGAIVLNDVQAYSIVASPRAQVVSQRFNVAESQEHDKLLRSRGILQK